MEELDRDGCKRVGRVVLAHEAPFTLSDLRVHPETLQVEQRGRSDSLEPRVMKVLVALSRANGKVVTRDELIEQCWEGQIVGEDAINRALSRVRHCASGFAGGCFALETIPRVGYRLTISQSSRVHRAAPSAGLSGVSVSRRAILGGAVGTTAMLASGAALWRPKAKLEPLPQAMKLYLHGIENRGQGSLQQSEQSVSYFREATRIDPNFAEAWGALAWGYRGLLAYGPRPDTVSVEAQCQSAAKRALALDPDNADASSALLLLKPFYRRWAEVEEGCRRLLDRHPGNSILQFNLGQVLCDTGRWRAAIPILAAVAKREQFWPLASYQLSHAMIAAERIEEAEDLIEHASRRWPRRTDYWLAKHRMLITADRAPEASSFASDLTKRPAGDEQLIRLELVTASAIASRADSEVKNAVSRLLAHVEEVPPHFGFVFVGIAMLGAVEPAFAMLEGYFFGRGDWARHRSERLATSFLFAGATKPLRKDNRFPALVEEIGLADYWNSAGREPDFRRYG